MGIHNRARDDHLMGGVGAGLPLFRYMAAGNQYGYDHHYVPDGLPYSEFSN